MAMKRRVTRSYSFCSGSDRFFGACVVGMIAKWSLILVLSKMRLFGLTQLLFRICLANWW